MFLIDSGVTASISGLTITGANSSIYGSGGGVHNDGTVALSGCTIEGNHGYYGAGLLNDDATATLTDCTISGNSATATASYSAAHGAGIANHHGTVHSHRLHPQREHRQRERRGQRRRRPAQ